METFAGRTALVTGATKGIGWAIARGLLEVGFRLAVTARTGSDVEKVAGELAADPGGDVLGIPSDVRDPVACQSLVDRVVEHFGGLDVLVNNAGVGRMAPIQDMSLEDFDVQIDTNLRGVYLMSRAAIPRLLKSPDAWIINIGSLAGRNTFPGGFAYNASKFGLVGMTEAMMLDLRHEGIRVSLIMPGSVDTDFGDSPAGAKKGWALTPADVARAVVDLLRYPANAHASRVELRPSRPPRKG